MSGLTLINFNREFEDAPQNNHRGKPSHFGFCSSVLITAIVVPCLFAIWKADF